MKTSGGRASTASHRWMGAARELAELVGCAVAVRHRRWGRGGSRERLAAGQLLCRDSARGSSVSAPELLRQGLSSIPCLSLAATSLSELSRMRSVGCGVLHQEPLTHRYRVSNVTFVNHIQAALPPTVSATRVAACICLQGQEPLRHQQPAGSAGTSRSTGLC